MAALELPERPRAGAGKPRPIDSYLGRRRQHREPLLAGFAGHLRIVLPLAALAVLMAGLIWPLVFDSATGFRLNTVRVTEDRAVYSTMDNPRFAGVEGNERPYVVTAERAVQQAKDDKVYNLTKPKGDIVNADGEWIFAQGDFGRLFQETRQLDVAGNVVVYHDKGHRLTGERARVDLLTGDVASDRPVHGTGPSGRVDADGMHVSRNGRLVVFTGRSHMLIDDRDGTDAVDAGGKTDADKAGGGR